MEDAWSASNPNGMAGDKKEQGFWILRNRLTKARSVQWLEPGGEKSIALDGKPELLVSHGIAWVHTHPGLPAKRVSPYHPIFADFGVSTANRAPGIIITHKGLLYFGPKVTNLSA